MFHIVLERVLQSKCFHQMNMYSLLVLLKLDYNIDFFDLGLRFLYDTTIANIFNVYSITLAQPTPISLGCVVVFVVLCGRHDIDPSVTLF